MRRFGFKLLLIALAVVFGMTFLACAMDVAILFLRPYIGERWAALIGGIFTIGVVYWAWAEIGSLIGRLEVMWRTRGR